MADSITDHLWRETNSKIFAASVTPTPGINSHDNQNSAAAVMSNSPAFRNNIFKSPSEFPFQNHWLRYPSRPSHPDLMHLPCQTTTPFEPVKVTAFQLLSQCHTTCASNLSRPYFGRLPNCGQHIRHNRNSLSSC